MKRLVIIIIIFSTAILFGQTPGNSKATGLFLSFSVGPRIPVDNFAIYTSTGYGFNMELAYADNELLPFFLYGKIGFEQYLGNQKLYQTTQYSGFSTNFIPINIGARFYFPPMIENIFLMMPIAEISVAYGLFANLHQFKLDSGRTNFSQDVSKVGFTLGGGFSMFLMEILASYNYFNNNQFLSFDLKVRIPLYVSL